MFKEIIVILSILLTSCVYKTIEMRSLASLTPVQNTNLEKIYQNSNWGEILSNRNLNIRPFIYNGIRIKSTSEIAFIPIETSDGTKFQLPKPFIIQIAFQPLIAQVSIEPLKAELIIEENETSIKPTQVYLIDKGKSCVFSDPFKEGETISSEKYTFSFTKELSKSSEGFQNWTCFVYVFDIKTIDPKKLFHLNLGEIKEKQEEYDLTVFFSPRVFEETISH